MHPLLIPPARALRLSPDIIITKLLARTVNHLLRGQELLARLAEIDNKSVTLSITDVPCKLHLHVLNGRLRPCRTPDTDVTISGCLEGFLQLATRRQDPDTLFFQRILTLEGATDTGVHIKNILDAMDFDWQAHIDAVFPATLAVPLKNGLRTAGGFIPDKLRSFISVADS